MHQITLKKTTVLAAALACLGALGSGCKSYQSMQGYPQQSYKVLNQIKTLTKLVNDQQTTLSDIDKNANTEARNKYLLDRLSLADLEYNEMLKKVSGLKNGLDAGKDIAVGTMGAVGALVGGGTGQILSAGVAATTATGIAVDKTFFYNSTMPSMITAMNAGRAKLLTDITIGMQKAYKDYPISTAFADLDAYYYAGTLQGAQANIQTTSGNTIQKEAANKANAPAIAKGNPEAVQNFKASRQ
jgi:hypothetical protein